MSGTVPAITDLVGRRIIDVHVEAERDSFTWADNVTLRLDDGMSVIFYGVWLNKGFAVVGWKARPALDPASLTT